MIAIISPHLMRDIPVDSVKRVHLIRDTGKPVAGLDRLPSSNLHHDASLSLMHRSLQSCESFMFHFLKLMPCLPDHRVGENGDWDAANSVMTPDNRTHYQVLGLQPYTVYSFRVLAVNTIGTSYPSKESYYMLTLREIPDGKADITKSGNASSTSITIHWNAPERERMNGEFLGYRIKYWPRDNAEDVGEVSLRDPDLRVSAAPASPLACTAAQHHQQASGCWHQKAGSIFPSIFPRPPSPSPSPAFRPTCPRLLLLFTFSCPPPSLLLPGHHMPS